MGKSVHWDICLKSGFVPHKWYEHQPLPCLENESCKILWDFNIQTDHVIEARRPDMIIIDNKKRKANIVDFAVPADHRIEQSQQRKIEDLKRELQKIWNMKISVMLIVIGALGTIPKSLESLPNKKNLQSKKKIYRINIYL